MLEGGGTQGNVHPQKSQASTVRMNPEVKQPRMEGTQIWLVSPLPAQGPAARLHAGAVVWGSGAMGKHRPSLHLALYEKHELEHILGRTSTLMIGGAEVAGEEASWRNIRTSGWSDVKDKINYFKQQ